MLRQPTRKQAVLSSVWGRLAHFARLGAHSGPAVYPEAHEVGKAWRERAAMSIGRRQEFERLLADGHQFERVPSGYRWTLTLDGCRSTQLYRTLLHEIGHQVHYLVAVERPRQSLDPDDPQWDALDDRYTFEMPVREKEDFAHRHADELGAWLRREKRLPFDRLADPDRLRDQGLDPAWFTPSDTQAQ